MPTRRCDGTCGEVGVAEQDAAAGRQMRAGDRPQQRRLAGAVGADQRQRLAALDAEADVAHRLQQAVPDVEPLDREHAHFGPPPR